MIKELMHDPIFLAGKSEIATKEDLPVAMMANPFIRASVMICGQHVLKS